MLDTENMKDVILHRYPFLLVDRILELEEGKRAIGIKNVTMNEEFFFKVIFLIIQLCQVC